MPGVENTRQEKASVFQTRERRKRLHRVRRTLGGTPLSRVIYCTDLRERRRCVSCPKAMPGVENTRQMNGCHSDARKSICNLCHSLNCAEIQNPESTVRRTTIHVPGVENTRHLQKWIFNPTSSVRRRSSRRPTQHTGSHTGRAGSRGCSRKRRVCEAPFRSRLRESGRTRRSRKRESRSKCRCSPG